MYPVFPTLALFRSVAGISVRQAAQKIGISHTYLSELEDFVVVPPPDMRTKSDQLLIDKAEEIMLMDMEEVKHIKFSIESDNAFFSLRQSLWNNLLQSGNLLKPDDKTPKDPIYNIRGPLLECLLRCYFYDGNDYYNRSRNNGVILFLPHKNSLEPLLPDVIANFCERYYSPESFRRRKPRGWKLVPPLFLGKEEFGVVFSTDFEDSRRIFNFHPSSYYFALFLLYSILKGVNISTSGISCTTNSLSEETFYKHESYYKNIRNYAEFSKYNTKHNNFIESATSVCKAQFTLTPPAFSVPNMYGDKKYKGDYPFIPTPEKTVIHICLTDLFFPAKWCWCLAPES